MKNNITSKITYINKFIITFLFLIIVECSILVLVALIPVNKLENNLMESADYLCKRNVFFYVNENDSGSKIDRYADSILLNIAYHYNSDSPFSSVMSSSYYKDTTKNENINLKASLSSKIDANTEYSRYWHGSISIIRPLLILFNVKQIYIILSIAIVGLLIILSLLLNKTFGSRAVFCLVISTVMTSLWYVPLSLEYSWTVIIMLVASIICILNINSSKYDIFMLFFIIGNITAYFDFLTTETLSVLFPMAIIILRKHHFNNIKNFSSEFKEFTKYGVVWLIGYVATWVSKWFLASIVLQKNIFNDALKQASYRAAGDTENLSGISVRLGAEFRNISCLFPFSLLKNPLPVVILFFTIAVTVIYLIHKEKSVTTPLLIILASIPYLRYFALSNHSYIHYFFTFRAQLTTIFCLSLILAYGSDTNMLKKEWTKLRKKIWKQKKNQN